MYPISNAVKSLFDAENAQTVRITGTDKNGTSISITDADLMIGTFNIDRYSCNGQKLEIGTAIASELNLTLNNAYGAFDSIVFEGAELFVEIGIADWTQANPTITYIPCGYFTPDQQPRRQSIITLKALDRMTRFDAVHPTLTPWTDNNGNVMTDGNGNIIYFCAELSFPCTVAQLVEQCCIRCQVPFSQSLSSLPNYNYQISALPTLQQSITFRSIIQWCAGIMGTCAFIDWIGNLVFKWYSSASYTTTTANRFISDLQENDISITGVSYTNVQGVNIISGNPDYTLDMTGNYLADATNIIAVKNALNGFTYRPFSASVIAAPYLWPMDVITFTDKDGVNHSCAITNVNFGINGMTQLQGVGETAQINKDVSESGLTKEQALVVEQAAEATRQLDDSLDQEGVFNRLTNNGADQGVILYDGKIYINASYIRTGELSADRISGGTLRIGGLDNRRGSIVVYDRDNNIIGEWKDTGLYINDWGIHIGEYPNEVGHFSEQAILNYGSLGLYITCRTSSSSTRSKQVLGISTVLMDDDDDSIRQNYLTSNFDSTHGENGEKLYIRSDHIQILPHYDSSSITSVLIDGNLRITNGSLTMNGYTGVSGTFTTANGKTVTVTNGIITSIV